MYVFWDSLHVYEKYDFIILIIKIIFKIFDKSLINAKCMSFGIIDIHVLIHVTSTQEKWFNQG